MTCTCCSDVAVSLHRVANLARARAFYEGLLELKPVANCEDEDSSWIEYDPAVTALVIAHGSTVDCNRSAEAAAATVGLVDFDAIVADLRDAGVRFVEEPQFTDSAWRAVVTDPDGNRIILHSLNVR